MLFVHEHAPDQFQPLRGNETLVSADGKRRAPVATILSESWNVADRSAFGVFAVEPAAVPTGQRVTAITYQRIEGEVREVVTTEPDIPTSVQPRQLKLALLAAGLLDDIEAFVAAASREVQISWEYATEFRREHPLLVALAPQAGLSAAQVDALFQAAAAIP